RPHRAGHPGDHEHVAVAQVGQRLVQLRARGELASHAVVDEDPVAAVRLQLVDLAVVVLALGADPCVTDPGHPARLLAPSLACRSIVSEKDVLSNLILIRVKRLTGGTRAGMMRTGGSCITMPVDDRLRDDRLFDRGPPRNRPNSSHYSIGPVASATVRYHDPARSDAARLRFVHGVTGAIT